MIDMQVPRHLNRLIAAIMAIASAICITTAFRIEYLNHKAGGAIQRKAEQEPHSKWRTGFGYLKAYGEVEATLRKEKGLSAGDQLSATENKIIRERLAQIDWKPSPRDKLGKVLQTWGLFQYPLALGLLSASLSLNSNHSRATGIPKWLYRSYAMVAILALGLAVYRGYFTSLAW